MELRPDAAAAVFVYSGMPRDVASEEGPDSVPPSLSVTEALQITFGKSESGEMTGGEAGGSCQGTAADGGGGGGSEGGGGGGEEEGQDSVQSSRDGLANQRGNACAMRPLLSPPQGLSVTPRHHSQDTSATAPLPTSCNAPRGEHPEARGALKRKSEMHVRDGRSRSARGGSVRGVAWPSLGTDTVRQHLRRRISKSAEPITDSSPPCIPSTAATTTLGSMMPVHATRSAPSTCHFRHSSATAALEAFSLSFQNCIHKQEIVFERLDAVVARLGGECVSTLNSGDGAGDGGGGGASLHSLSCGTQMSIISTVSAPSSAPLCSDLRQRALPSDHHHCVPTADATGEMLNQPGLSMELPGISGKGRSSDAAPGMADDDSSRLDGGPSRIKSSVSPVLSPSSSSLKELSLADEYDHARHHHTHQSSRSSTPLSVVVMRPALERMSVCSGGAPTLRSSPQHGLSPLPNILPLALPNCVRLEGAAAAQFSVTPVTLSHPPQNVLSSSATVTPPSPTPIVSTRRRSVASSDDSRCRTSPTKTPFSLDPFTSPAATHTSLPSSSCEEALSRQRCSAAAGAEAAEAAGDDSDQGALGTGLSSSVRARGARGHESCSAADLAAGSSGSAFSVLHADPMLWPPPAATPSTDAAAAQQSWSNCCGTGGDGVPTWSQVSSRQASSGFVRSSVTADCALSRDVTTQSLESVSLSPLSRPPSNWGGYSMTRGIIPCSLSPLQMPLAIQSCASLGKGAVVTAGMSPRQPPNSLCSGNTSSVGAAVAAGGAPVALYRSPRAGATLEHLRQASATPASTGSLLSPNPPQLLYCSPRDQVSTFSGTWISSSSSSTPRCGHPESGMMRYGSAHRVSIESRDSAQQILSSTNTNVTLGRLAAMTTEGSVVSSLSTTSPLLPMLPAYSGGEATRGCSTDVSCRTQAGSSSPPANRALVFSPSQSAERGVLDPSVHESVRSSPSPSSDDREDEYAHQLLRLGNRYSPPPPPPSLTELQQAQNQLRRWSAPPVPTMRRPPMAPVRGTNTTMVSSSRDGEVGRPRSVTPPAARPEQRLSFEEQHERLHLPECWRDSEVVVVDHERMDRDYDAQEAARRQLLESHDLSWKRPLAGLDDDDDGDDGDCVLRHGRVRGSGYRNSTLGVSSMMGADNADEMRGGEKLHWGGDSSDEDAQGSSSHHVQPVMPLHLRGVSQASPHYVDTEDRLRSRSPYSHMHSRGRRSVTGERGGINPDSTSPTRAEPSAADTASVAVADGQIGFSGPSQRSSSGRRSTLATLSGADNGVEWTDLQARFDELLRIQRRSRGSEQYEADGCIPGEQTLQRLPDTAASPLAREDVAGNFPRRRQSRSHSFSHGVTSCLRGAEGEWGQGASHRSGGDLNDGCVYDALQPIEEGHSFPSRSTHTLPPFPMPLERTHTHPSTGHYGESQWKERLPVDGVPRSLSPRGEDEGILSHPAFSLGAAAISSPREHGDTPSPASRAQVPTLCKKPPAFLTSPRRPSVTVNAAHTTGRNTSARSHNNTSRYDSDEEEEGVEERCVIDTDTHTVSTRPRTPRLRFPQSSRAASSIVKLGRKRRCVVALHMSAAKEHRGFYPSRREGDAGETTSSSTDCAGGLLSAVQSLQAAVVTSSPAVTATVGKKGKRATAGLGGRGFARGPSRVSGGRVVHLSPTNSVSRDSLTTALTVPAIETEGGRAAGRKESNCDITSTCPPMTARMSTLHLSDHALDGGELAEPYSPVLMAAAAAAASGTPPPPPPPPMPKAAQDSGTQRGRLRDRKVNSSRGHGKEHEGRFVLFVSPSRHRHPKSSGAEGEAAVSGRPLIKASARHAPGPLEGEGKHQDGGVAPGASAADGIDSRAFLRRLAQHKSRTRAMEQRMGSINTSAAQAHTASVGHTDNSGSGGVIVLSSGLAAGKQGPESGSCAGVEVARQDALLPSRVCAAPAAVGGASSDAFPACGAAAWPCGDAVADAVHVTVIDPAEASGVYTLHTAPSGFSFGVAPAGQHVSPKPRRRRIDLRTRLTHKMSVFSSSGPASRSKISTAAFAATTDATPPAGSAASAHFFRRAESGYTRLHSDSPLMGSHTHHVICGDRRRLVISNDAQSSSATSVLDRLPRPTRNPQASQLVG